MGTKRTARRLGAGILSVLLVLALAAGAASATIDVVGEFDATLGGYGDETSELHENEIRVDGQLILDGEDAQNVRISLSDAEHTVLDASSTSVFVEGDESVSFDRQFSANGITIHTEEVPAGTTIRIEFSTYFTGDTDDDEILASTVDVEYETTGGTPDSDSFEVTADTTESANNQLNRLERGDDISTVQEILSYIGGIAIIALLVVIGMKVLGGGSKSGPPGPP